MSFVFVHSPTYARRVVDDQLDTLFASLPAVAIDGPKAVGKTATASQRAASVVALDRPDAMDIVRADPDRVIAGVRPVLIDEWQRFEPSWDLVRRAVDVSTEPGQFLLTGSASPSSPQTHSGAGRIVGLRMRPLTLPERAVTTPSVSLRSLLAGGRPTVSGATSWGLEEYTEEIIGGGFPGMRTLPAPARRTLLDGYVDRIVDRDFPEAGRAVRNPAALRRWLRAFAAATGTAASFETIRDAASAGQAGPPAKSTTIPYRDTLERIWISDPVPAWSPTGHRLTRLTGNPKHFLADPALAASLLDVDAESLLDGRAGGPPIARNGTLLGALFESLVTLTVKVFAQAADARVGHLRTKGGEREIDFIISGRGGRTLAVEAKLSATVDGHDVRHLLWLKQEMPDLTDMVIVTTGREAYRRKDGVAVVPLALLGP